MAYDYQQKLMRCTAGSYIRQKLQKGLLSANEILYIIHMIVVLNLSLSLFSLPFDDLFLVCFKSYSNLRWSIQILLSPISAWSAEDGDTGHPLSR